MNQRLHIAISELEAIKMAIKIALMLTMLCGLSLSLQPRNLPQIRRGLSLCVDGNGLNYNRRSWLQISVVGVASSKFVLPPAAAHAAEEPTMEVHEAFDKVRIEVEKGGFAKLDKFIEDEDWDKILEFTKLYDLSFRKFLMKSAANGIIDKEAHDKAMKIRNDVTFDLIAVNKAARPKYRSVAKPAAEEAMKVLRGDLSSFLGLEPPTL